MASWALFEAEAPELAKLARGFLDAGVHKTIATLRADGSPRISGIEVKVEDGELVFGSMAGARKVADLRRDARFALHSASPDPDEWTGDAKVAGRAVEPTENSFRADLTEVSVVRLSDDRKQLVIEVWKPGRPVRTMYR